MKDILSGCISALLLIFMIFSLSQWVPIDATLAIIGDGASFESYTQARESLQLDASIWSRMCSYIYSLCQGDLGISYRTAQPVYEDLMSTFPATFELAIVALSIGVLGIPLGVLSAWRPRSIWNRLVQMQLFVYSIPTFVLGIIGLLIFYVNLGWVEGPGRISVENSDLVRSTSFFLFHSLFRGDWEIFIDAFKHLILPASILGFFCMATLSRMTKSFLQEQLSQPYILTAILKGIPPKKILWGHAFRNILLPLVTLLAMSFASLLEGAIIIETIFAWPGIGNYLTQSIMFLDTHAFLGVTLLIGFIFIGFNITVDLLTKVMDPRGVI